MAYLNDNYLKLRAGYLFPEIGRRVSAFCEANPAAAKRLIRCGIGDVTEPLPAAAIAALHKAVDEMGNRETFHGYGPEQGYDFLRHAIAQNDFRDHGLDVADDEIFVSDGSKCDCGNILDILGHENNIAVMDPVYPVYVDTNVMAGHTGPANEAGAYAGLVYLPCNAGQRLRRRHSGEQDRHRLSLLPEQPDRRGGDARTTHTLGRIRAAPRGDPALRRGLRGLHQRTRHSAFDLRDSRRARVRDRVPQFLEKRRLHRHALRVHRGSQIAQRTDGFGGKTTAASALASPHEHEVQRRELHRAARGRGALHAGRQGAGPRAHRALHGQRENPARGVQQRRPRRFTAASTRLTSG